MNNRLKKLRKNHLHLTQSEFGKKIGLTDVAISRYEKGERNITRQVLISICREFNVNEEWLRTGQGEMFNYSEDDSLIEKLSAEYKLDGFVKKLLKKYLELTEQQRNAVNSFLNKVYEEEFANVQSSENIANEISVTEEKEIPSEYTNMSVEELLKQSNMIENLLEKKQVEELSALQNIKNA